MDMLWPAPAPGNRPASYSAQAAIMSAVPIKLPSMGMRNQHRQEIAAKSAPTAVTIGFSQAIWYCAVTAIKRANSNTPTLWLKLNPSMPDQ